MNALGVGFLFLLAAAAGLVLLIVALVDLVKRKPEEWAAAGQNQLVWALIVIFLGLIGPVLYLAIARPALDGASRVAEVPVDASS